jgi:dihydroorotate dehydrogenase
VRREFHLVRTGGVEGAEDVRLSLDAGASLVQWYTAYFEAFALHGDDLYRILYEELLQSEA